MDPLSAVSLAGNAIQFVCFTANLIGTAKEIHHSAEGCLDNVSTLQTIYRQLQELSNNLLTNSSYRDCETAPEGSMHRSAIRHLSQLCKNDCDKLLDVIENIEAKSASGRVWKSFKSALRVMWKAEEIASLEERLHRTQTSLTLHTCAIMMQWHNVHHKDLKSLAGEARRLGAQQAVKLEEIATSLQELESHVQTNASSISGTFGVMNGDTISSLERQMSRLQLSETDIKKQQNILKSLSFESRPMRHSSIPYAHAQTFGWAFQDPKSPTAATKLVSWLQEGDGIFWISGKPGSGKSTFMKYLAEASATQRLLDVWSRPLPTIIACHYFWSAGTVMQKSQQGLLQTLIFEILRQCPDLIESTCRQSDFELAYQPYWDMSELHQILQKLSQRDDLEIKFCIFIDGLDEYEGNHLEFCAALRNLSESVNVKLCVASRPWNAFTDAFGQDSQRTLYMHEMTESDIRNYTTDRLHSHPRWKSLLFERPSADILVDQVVGRASGVFLWVHLVTDLLRRSLTEGDSYFDLRGRLDSCPSDLERFFRHILKGVETFHQEKMATSLRIAMTARSPLDLLLYSFHDRENENPEYALNLPIENLSKEVVKTRTQNATRQLSARSRGLLHISVHGKVELLHRTVADFLRRADMSAFLDEKSPAIFNPSLSLLRGYIAWMKAAQFRASSNDKRDEFIGESVLHSRVNDFVAYASLAPEEGGCCELLKQRVLDEFDHNILLVFDRGTQVFFRERLLEARLVPYLDHAIPNCPYFFSGFAEPPLRMWLRRWREQPWSTETLRCLLNHGEDPNELWQRDHDEDSDELSPGDHDEDPKEPWQESSDSETPWKEFLQRVLRQGVKDRQVAWYRHDLCYALKEGLFHLFLASGAEPDPLFVWTRCGTTLREIFILASLFVPTDADAEVLYLSDLDKFYLDVTIDDSWYAETTCAHLIARLARRDWPYNCRVVTQVVNRLLSRTHRLYYASAHTWDDFESVLPAHYCDWLKSKYMDRDRSSEPLRDTHKRARRDDAYLLTSPKRRK